MQRSRSSEILHEVPHRRVQWFAKDPYRRLTGSGATDAASEQRKIQTAKDFESVFISKLLDQMKDTIVDWGLERDEASKQVHGISWLYLARDLANQGGFGLWKDVYEFLNNSEGASANLESSG